MISPPERALTDKMKGECLKYVKKNRKKKKKKEKENKRKTKAFFSFFSKCWHLQQHIKFFQDTTDEQLGQFLCPSGAYVGLIKQKKVLWQNTEPLYGTRRNRRRENKASKCFLQTAFLLHGLQLPTQSILRQITPSSNHTCGKQLQNMQNGQQKFKTSMWTFT